MTLLSGDGTTSVEWHATSVADTAGRLEVDVAGGLSEAEAARRLATVGPNALPTEPPPSLWVVARGQLLNPMNIMLLIVAVASIVIGQVATGIFVAAAGDVQRRHGHQPGAEGPGQRRGARAAPGPAGRVRRDGRVEPGRLDRRSCPATSCCWRRATSSRPTAGSSTVGHARGAGGRAHRGERAGRQGRHDGLPARDIALGDRTNMVFQNTQVTRGTATFVVTATGQATQMGRIADMVTATKRVQSPLQRELDGLTKIFGAARLDGGRDHRDRRASSAVRTPRRSSCCASRPRSRRSRSGLPTFVQTMLSSGAQRLAESQGGREVAHRRRDARRHDGHQQRQDRHADDERDDRDHDARRRRLVHDRGRRLPRRPARSSASAAASVAGLPAPRARPRAVQRRDGRRRRVGHRRPDRGRARRARGEDRASSAEETRDALPRRAEVPFDSEYKFMATFHDRPDWLTGGVLQAAALHDRQGRARRRHRPVQRPRCGTASRCRSTRSATSCSPPTSSCPSRVCGCWPSPLATSTTTRWRPRSHDPMAAVHDLMLVALVGIIDPLRAEAEARGPRRARRRHRRPHDHRRPHRHRARDRRPARARSRCHHRAPSCSSSPTTR